MLPKKTINVDWCVLLGNYYVTVYKEITKKPDWFVSYKQAAMIAEDVGGRIVRRSTISEYEIINSAAVAGKSK